MKSFTIAVVGFSIWCLQGCEALDDQRMQNSQMLNPKKFHEGTKKVNYEGMKAREVPSEDYYQALKLARPVYAVDQNSVVTAVTVKSSDVIVNYVDEGIGFVDSHCRRWFQELDDMSRLLAFQNKNINVISQLGTTLLGVGGASAAWITGYGAANTAYAGASENFNSAFLIAPTASKVKEHIEGLMKQEADRLRTDSATLSFKQAYTRLEHYADLCTHVRAKEIVDAALETTKTTLNADNQPHTTPKVMAKGPTPANGSAGANNAVGEVESQGTKEGKK